MIVDMRLRPPLPSLLDTPLFKPGAKSSTSHADYPRAPSADARSPDLLLREMDAAGIELGVVMGRQSSGGLGSVPNTELADWISRYPDRFVAWAGIDVTQPMEQILAEVAESTGRRGFKGVSLEPSIAPGFTGTDDKRLYPLYDDCQQRDIPISITLSAILQASEGRPVEYGTPIQLYRVALDFPKLAIHVAHAAWPWVMEMIGVAFTRPNIWISPDQYLLPPLPGAQLYAQAAVNFFQDRTLFGTAYPFKPLPEMVSAYRSWNWPKLIEQQILSENALRLMRMK
ncbi:MAG: amidohydrolase family protein [Betaproteobacteria bacterium]|nr:amidohydrolase family protein [Betaproteobacteria bacterium]